MNRSLTFAAMVLACGLGGQVSAGPCDGINFDKVIFKDDFDTVTPCNIPDPNEWVLNHPIPPDQPGACWWVQGRTFFPNPRCDYEPDPPFPHVVVVENGRDDRACAIEHYQYNPYDIDPNDPSNPNHVKTTFLGGEIHTIMEFQPTQCYRFEARVRWPQAPRGLVASFFTYGYDEVNQDSDEIDFEFLSNEVFDGDHKIHTVAWDDSVQCPLQVSIPELDLTQWQVFRIYWCPDTCVKWTWINPVTDEEVVLRTETDAACMPDEWMQLYFNFWAADALWEKAYDGNLVPDQQDNGVKYEYFIDYVEVRVPEPASCMVLAVGAVCLLVRRRQSLRPPH